jgi:hypothetical protein
LIGLTLWRRPAVVTAVAAAMLACVPQLAACAKHSQPAASDSSAASATSSSIPAAPPAAGVLPPPEALTDVLYRLADTSVPSDQKVPLVEGATNEDAAKLDKFGKALADSGYTPLAVTAENVAWASSLPGNVTADVTVHSQNPNATNGFTFPMEFKPAASGGWQLSKTTADILLTFNQNPATPTPPSPTPTG